MRAVGIVLAALALVATSTAAARPSLALDSSNGVVVRGSGFGEFERLRVTAFVGGGSLVRQVTTTRLGRFTLRLDVRREPCTAGHVVQAFGRRSGLVRLRLPVRECPNLAPGSPLAP